MMAVPLASAEFHLLNENTEKAHQELEFLIWMFGRRSELQARWP